MFKWLALGRGWDNDRLQEPDNVVFGLLSATSLLIVLLAASCSRAPSPGSNPLHSANQIANSSATNTPFNRLTSTNNVRSFLTRGIVRELPVDGNTVVIRHEDIPGLMPRMTMTFNVQNTNELRGLTVGDTVTFRVKATDEESWIEGVQRAGTNNPAGVSSSDPASTALLHIAKLNPGDMLPDANVLAEDGKTIKLSHFRGRALAFTFIFTRCPLPDFCPRMNQHFSRARELLLQQKAGPTNWQFLSISFDPEFDKPGVLARYAYVYRGPSPDRWLFASAPGDVMTTMSSGLDFRFANEAGSFVHNLRTVVIDPEGRLFRQFDGNRWKAEELAEAMREAALGNRPPLQ